MAIDRLAPFGGGGESRTPLPTAARLQIPTFDPVLEAQGGYGPQTITRPLRGDILRELQRDITADPEFRRRADMLARQRFELATRGLPHHQISLMQQSLLPSLMLSAMQDRDLQARYQRDRYGFDPSTRRFLAEYEEERIPGLGNQRRAIELLTSQQRTIDEARRPALGPGLTDRFRSIYGRD